MEDSRAKAYWAPVPLLLLGGVCCLAFFLVGFSMAFSYFQDPESIGGVSGLVIGIVACALSILMARTLIGSKLVVTSAGISVWRRMRRQMIPWDAIKSFEIGAASSRSFLPAVVVVLESEKFPVKATAGFSKRVNAIKEELTATQQHYLVLQLRFHCEYLSADSSVMTLPVSFLHCPKLFGLTGSPLD